MATVSRSGQARAPEDRPSSAVMSSAADASGARTEGRSGNRPSILTVTLVGLGVAAMLGLAGLSAAEGLLGWDVRFAYLPAAEAVLDGNSPYPALDDPILDEQKGYVYPPQLLFVLLPLTVLPVGVASTLVAAGMIALLLLTLRVLEVRDIRCYAATLLWVPAISGVLLSNLSIPLAFALALMWRFRDDVWPSSIALGLAVSAKLLLWPMFVWTLATRRFATFALAVLVGFAVTLAAWAAIGFDGLSTYPDLLDRLSELQSERSYSLVGMAATSGLDPVVGSGFALLVGVGLLGGCVSFARRGDEPRAFTCAIAATLALSPVVWLHYLVALLVPMAILRPRFSALWLLPVLLWVSPKPGYAEGVQTFGPGIAVAILVTILLVRPSAPSRAAVAAS
jgi:Glycosyltransferase family 87